MSRTTGACRRMGSARSSSVSLSSKMISSGSAGLSTAEAFAHPLTQFVAGDYMALLAEIGKPVDGLIEPADDGYFRRTCCLWIALPDVEPCASCCVLRPPHRS